MKTGAIITKKCCSKGFTLLEVLIAISLSVLIITFALPSFRSWLDEVRFRNFLVHLGELAKSGRVQALYLNQPIYLVIAGGSSKCAALSKSIPCDCNPVSKSACEIDGVFKGAELSLPNIQLSTTSGPNKIVTFNAIGTLDFGSSTTITLKHEGKHGRITINSLGRVKWCSNSSMSGVATC